MAYQEPDLPVAQEPVSVSAFGSKVRNSIMWLKEQIDILATALTFSYRQGGSATDWNAGGTTNYAITSLPLIQVGSYHFSMTSVLAEAHMITFNTPFSVKPIVFTGAEFISGNTTLFKSTSVEDITTDNFYLSLNLISSAPSSPPVVIDVFWIAVCYP